MNPYLTKLRGLSKENLQVTEPSKPSKPSFDGFEDEQSSRLSGNEPVEFEQCYYRNAPAALRSKCPELVESDRWQQAIHDANSFLATWGAQAQAFGWTERELFGLHPVPEQPTANYSRLSRLDETGLIWLLQDRPVVALTAMEAIMRCQSGATLVYRRRNQSAPGLIGDSTNGGGVEP